MNYKKFTNYTNGLERYFFTRAYTDFFDWNDTNDVKTRIARIIRITRITRIVGNVFLATGYTDFHGYTGQSIQLYFKKKDRSAIIIVDLFF